MRNTRKRATAASFASALLILALGLSPATFAADHLDSPAVAAKGAVDITDLYVFSGLAGNTTVFVLGVNPGAGALANSGTTFGPGVTYKIKVDTDGDLKPNLRYKFRFGNPNGMGVQSMDMWRNGAHVVDGWTDQNNNVSGGGKTTAGLFDDPFFFDLAAFQGQILGSGNGESFCDADPEDFFLGLNISAIVLRVPNSQLGGSGSNIAVWATTEAKRGAKQTQLDQVGRPAINTVFNNDNANKYDRELFNRTQPSEQSALFQDHVEDVLTALGAADPAGLADVLIADVMTYETGNTSGFLNGRRLDDDVIDAELNLVTDGGITTDCIADDSATTDTWPYLAPAN
ncbi:MAG: DUF4331 family protein [Chloroflexota bacterium]